MMGYLLYESVRFVRQSCGCLGCVPTCVYFLRAPLTFTYLARLLLGFASLRKSSILARLGKMYGSGAENNVRRAQAAYPIIFLVFFFFSFGRYPVDGKQYQIAILTPLIIGVVVPTISILFGTLVSMSVSTLRQRQLNVRQSLNQVPLIEYYNRGHALNYLKTFSFGGSYRCVYFFVI